MEHRHLDHSPDTPVTELGPAALDDLLDRGDLVAWAPLAAAIRADPSAPIADTVLRLCEAHPMYGTSRLWSTWIERLRRQGGQEGMSLAGLRRKRGRTQSEVGVHMGISQSDVSKLERRHDMRLQTLRAYIKAAGVELELIARDPSGELTPIEIP